MRAVAWREGGRSGRDMSVGPREAPRGLETQPRESAAHTLRLRWVACPGKETSRGGESPGPGPREHWSPTAVSSEVRKENAACYFPVSEKSPLRLSRPCQRN